jgi:hypothetical protein
MEMPVITAQVSTMFVSRDIDLKTLAMIMVREAEIYAYCRLHTSETDVEKRRQPEDSSRACGALLGGLEAKQEL